MCVLHQHEIKLGGSMKGIQNGVDVVLLGNKKWKGKDVEVWKTSSMELMCCCLGLTNAKDDNTCSHSCFSGEFCISMKHEWWWNHITQY